MSEAERHNTGKPELSQLLHFDLAWLADHMAAGRAKYPDNEDGPNWKLGGKPDQEYLDSATRHLQALVNGEEFDSELGTHHAAAIAWNMLALLTCNRTYGDEIVPASAERIEVQGTDYRVFRNTIDGARRHAYRVPNHDQFRVTYPDDAGHISEVLTGIELNELVRDGIWECVS